MTAAWGIAVAVTPPETGWSAVTWERLLDDIVAYCEDHALHAGGGAGPDGLTLGISPAETPWRDAHAGDAHRDALLAIIRGIVPQAPDAAVVVRDLGTDDD